MGLEAKRELHVGRLRDRSGLAPAVLAALGGMALAVLIYLAFTHDGGHADGWGAATSTDRLGPLPPRSQNSSRAATIAFHARRHLTRSRGNA